MPIPSPTAILLRAFNYLEDKVHTQFPTARPSISAFIIRDYSGNLSISYNIGDSFATTAKGTDLEDTINEYLRRLGFEESQSKLSIEGAVLDASAPE